jgi:hypothetical protein
MQGFVAFVDLLGFKNLITSPEFDEVAAPYMAEIHDACAKEDDLSYALASDSVVITRAVAVSSQNDELGRQPHPSEAFLPRLGLSYLFTSSARLLNLSQGVRTQLSVVACPSDRTRSVTFCAVSASGASKMSR